LPFMGALNIVEYMIGFRERMYIAVVSQSRSDYGIYYPLLKYMEKQKDIKFKIVLTGMHFSKEQGYTYRAVHEDWPYETLVNPVWGDIGVDIPDWVIVLGDTWPMLDYTIKVRKLGIPVAHIHAGDISDNLDNDIRDAISALSQLLFPALESHAIRLGERGYQKLRIETVGHLGIYDMPDAEYLTREQLNEQLNLSDKSIILVAYHPESFSSNEAGKQMREVLEAVNNPNWQPVVIYPNSDPGSEDMIRVINQYPYHSFNNLPYLVFQSLLKASKVIVGNSSCGLVEAPAYGVPCVNIGNRQYGRHNLTNFNTGCDAENIHNLIMLALISPIHSNNPYKDDKLKGGAQRIINKLKTTPINRELFQKVSTK